MKIYKFIIFLFLIQSCQNNKESHKVLCVNKISSLIKTPEDKKFIYNDDWMVKFGDYNYQIKEILAYKNCYLDSLFLIKSEGCLEYDVKAIEADTLLNQLYQSKKEKKVIFNSNSIIDNIDTLQVIFKFDNKYIVINKKKNYYLYEIADSQ